MLTCISCVLQKQNQSNDRLTNYPSNCSDTYLPFKYDDSKAENGSLKDLCQDGYIIHYSTRRRTPLFTAQRLNGSLLKAVRENVRKNDYINFVIMITCIQLSIHYQAGLKLSTSGVTLD